MSKDSSKSKKHDSKHKKHKHGDKHKKHDSKHKKHKHGDKHKNPESEKECELGKGKVERFDQLVSKNKTAGRSWNHELEGKCGLEGKWWRGMTEDEVRGRLLEVEQILAKIRNIGTDKENKPETIVNVDKPETITNTDKENKPETIVNVDKPETITNTDKLVSEI